MATNYSIRRREGILRQRPGGGKDRPTSGYGFGVKPKAILERKTGGEGEAKTRAH